MAPIYESDVAEERFAKGEWNHYELWERVELRLRRHQRLWILAAVLLFLALSSVPTLMEHLPRWRAFGASRRLAQEVNWIKRQAGIDHVAYRLRFRGHGSLDYAIERVSECSPTALVQVTMRSRNLMPGQEKDFLLLDPARGGRLGVPGLVEQFCYDPLKGSPAAPAVEDLVAFAVIPVADLDSGRLDRLGLLLLSGPSADPAF